MLTQPQMYYQAATRSGETDQHFLDMISDEENPLTATDLKKLIERWPHRWSRYAGFVKLLEARDTLLSESNSCR